MLVVGASLLLMLSQHPTVSLVMGKRIPYLRQLCSPGLSEWQSQRRQANSLLKGGHTAAVYDRERFHEEVHGSVLWTLAQFEDIVVKIYRPEWRFGFDGAIKSWWPEQPTPIVQFWDDLERDSSIRWIFFPTIDFY